MIMRKVAPPDLHKISFRREEVKSVDFGGILYQIKMDYFRDGEGRLWEHWVDFDIWWRQDV